MAASSVVSIDDLSKLSDSGGKDALGKKLVSNLRDLKQYKVTKNYVLVGLYIGGEKHAGSSIIRVDTHEDVYQSNCGLVISLGPTAFKRNDGTDEPNAPKIGDWIYYRGGHQRMQINGVNYAFLHEDDVVSTVPEPSWITHKKK